MADESAQAATQITVENYTAVSKIRKRIRSIGDMAVPLKRGLGEDQLVAILGTLALLGIIYGLVLAPIVHLLHITLTWAAFAVYLIVPTFLAAQKIGTPMKSAKTVSGTVSSLLRSLLDDPVHRRGVPQARKTVTGRRLHYQRQWVSADITEPVDSLATGAGDENYHYENVSFLDRWMAEHSVQHEEQRAAEVEEKKLDRAARQTMLHNSTDQTVTFD
ncbi:hypothetical protein GCM10025867_46740 (plasmid) [Frondihabitans sucicola]|uniref:Uncharacterized protein n=1 Tax=Frondihabitans sucicola TaxID=1268041 RepID=A0ABM8GVD1_9MICO|nr:hypothetical protein [Frondihabitans sucicola]BDZ52433.1 hypothetical protein GCM10025867_46740 [Frondihabitans sucicola]